MTKTETKTRPAGRQAAAGASTAVVKPEAKGTAVAVHDYGDDSGAGFETQDSSMLSIPFIALLQANSPQCEGEDAKGRPGMLFNTVTEDYISGKEGFIFIPAYIDHKFVEWVPRNKGGGFVAAYEPDSDMVARAQRRERKPDQKRAVLIADNDVNEILDTHYLYGVIADADGNPNGFGVISFVSTKIKVFRNYNTKLNLYNFKKDGLPARPPLFANSIRVTSVKESNAEGDFFNFALTPAVDGDVKASMLAPDSPLYQAAKDVYAMVSQGRARAAHETERATTGTGAASETVQLDDEIPF